MRCSQLLDVVGVPRGGGTARVGTGDRGDVPGERVPDERAYLTEHDGLRLRLLQEQLTARLVAARDEAAQEVRGGACP